MPAREIGTGDITHLAALHECIERAQRFLNRGPGIKPMDGIDIEVIGVEAAQAGFTGAKKMIP